MILGVEESTSGEWVLENTKSGTRDFKEDETAADGWYERPSVRLHKIL